MPTPNLHLNSISGTVKSKQFNWHGHLTAFSEGKPLHIEGKGDAFPKFEGLFHIKSTDFPIAHTSEYLIYLSTDLALIFHNNQITLKGDIRVPKAELKPIYLNDSNSLASDVVFKNETENTEKPWPFSSDITVTMGEHVDLDLHGLHGLLVGQLKLKATPDTPLYAIGELNIHKGSYKAYGQNLKVEHGELIFTGNTIDNPGISLRATRVFNNSQGNLQNTTSLFNFNQNNLDTVDFGSKTTVGIEIVGRVKSHKINLFSNPPTLSQADILSMLILGKPAIKRIKRRSITSCSHFFNEFRFRK